MSNKAREVFDSIRAMKETVGTALQGLKNFGPQVGAEFNRMATQGASELASVLFNGQGYVPYGQGQYRPDVNAEIAEPDKARDDEGMER